MGAGHAHPLYRHGHSPVHRMAPEIKVAAAFLFVLAVALTPRRALWAFAVDAAVLLVVLRLARLPARFVLARMAIVVPFAVSALLVPLVAGGEQTAVLGLEVSRLGLWGAVNILVKALLGVGVSILLAGTTEQAAILTGLERLGVPVVLTTIAAFMLRYVVLIATEISRLRTAMAARGYRPRWMWQTRPLAAAAGALFIRSYERGERTHAAMLSRGFAGSMPGLERRRATRLQWIAGACAPAVAATAATAALVVG